MVWSIANVFGLGIMGFDPRHPTFEEIRKLTRNGQQRVRVLIYGASVECRAKVSRTRAQIDFDLHSCNYDLRPEASELLLDEYNCYRVKTGFRTRLHPHFSRSSIWFDVHRVHADEWFQRVLRAIQDPGTVTLCDAAVELGDYLQQEADELLIGALIETRKAAAGEAIVRMVAPAWLELVRLIQANPNIMHSMADRNFEELIAGAYKRAGFDKVVLTPQSARPWRGCDCRETRVGAYPRGRSSQKIQPG